MVLQIQLMLPLGGGVGGDWKGHKEDLGEGANSVFFRDQGPGYTGSLSLFKCIDLYAYDL